MATQRCSSCETSQLDRVRFLSGSCRGRMLATRSVHHQGHRGGGGAAQELGALLTCLDEVTSTSEDALK